MSEKTLFGWDWCLASPAICLMRMLKTTVWKLIHWFSSVVDVLADSLLRVKTSGAIRYESNNSHPVDNQKGNAYDCVSCRYLALFKIVSRLKLNKSDVVYDIGAGFGRAAFVFSFTAANKVVGLEFEADAVAQFAANRTRFRGNQNKIQISKSDATKTILDDATVLFLFNPLRSAGMEAFSANVEASLERNPRKLKLVYYTPRHLSSLRKIDGYNEVDRFSTFQKLCVVVELDRS